MRVSQIMSLDFGGAVVANVDLSKVKMSDEQRSIVGKLFGALKRDDVNLLEDGDCEAGNCLASRYLPDNEFQKIRSLQAVISTDAQASGLICDFCLKCVVVK